MKFKLLLALVQDEKVDSILKAARKAGATGATVITSARGEGLKPRKTFFGLDLEGQRDVILLVVEEHLSHGILQTIAEVGEFDTKPGTGIAFQLAVENAVGLSTQINVLIEKAKK